jgi:hypothetical protein
MKEDFNGLEWDIDEMPVGASTPDDKFELTYLATATCPNCGEEIQGEAHFWSDDEDMIDASLHTVHYEPCDCTEDDEEEEEDEL